jgi:hypothetical protein
MSFEDPDEDITHEDRFLCGAPFELSSDLQKMLYLIFKKLKIKIQEIEARLDALEQ